MDTKRYKRKKRIKVKNPRTISNVIKKRLTQEYWKANALIGVIFIILISVVIYFVSNMPIPKFSDGKDAYKEDYKKLEEAKREHKK